VVSGRHRDLDVRAAGGGHSRRRADIQGLRALAVLAVVLYHAGFLAWAAVMPAWIAFSWCPGS
jgi:peptidoglycan/LPS O-acetylase OafA/YrhL